MKTRLAIVILAALFAFLPQLVSAQADQAEWTLMFYMDSDNNLEAPQMNDLKEMMAVGSTAKINLIGLIDRSEKGDDVRGYTDKPVGGLPNWTTAKYVVIEKGKLRQMADWGELNMGDPANLKRFLDETSKQFPAKRYGLIFGDHGAGWPGILADESAKGDSIDMTELSATLKTFTATAGKLELIGFDACLMGNFEVARTVSPFAKTMVASEEVEPGNGWDYTPMLTAMNKNPEMDGIAFGKIIVDTYKAFYTSPEERDTSLGITLGVIDLSKIDALANAISDLALVNQAFIKAGGTPSVYKVAQARSHAEEFGRSKEFSFEDFDVVHYAQNVKVVSPDAASVKAADAVIAAAKAAVVYKVSGAAHPKASGLSIYFPSNKNNLLGYGYSTYSFFPTTKWGLLLGEYYGLLGADTQPPQIQNIQSNDVEIAKGDVAIVTAKVKADDIDESTFVIARNEKDVSIIIGSVPSEPDEKGVLHEDWDGTWFTIGDGKNQQICPVTGFEETDAGKDEYIAEVPAQVRYKGEKEWSDVTLYFLLDFKETDATGKFIYAFEYEKNQAREVELDTGDSIRPVYLVVTANGDTKDIASPDEADVLHFNKTDGLVIGNERVEAGNYSIGFLITDYAGNTAEKFIDVTVK